MRPAVLYFAPLLLLPLFACDGYLTEPEALSVAEVEQQVRVPNPPDYTGKTAKTIDMYWAKWENHQLQWARANDDNRTDRKLEIAIYGPAGPATYPPISVSGTGYLSVEADPPYPTDRSDHVAFRLYKKLKNRGTFELLQEVVCWKGFYGNGECYHYEP